MFTPDDLGSNRKKDGRGDCTRREKFVRESEPREEALAEFAREGEFMKTHFVTRFTHEGEQVSFYRNGSFVDFCRDLYVPSTGRVKEPSRLRVWPAHTGWATRKIPNCSAFTERPSSRRKRWMRTLHGSEEAAKRDHRVLGKQLDLFSIQEVAGAGLIFWHPQGSHDPARSWRTG